ncbi:MAG: YbjN domain-containing protein [Chitinophagaceae bacterium]|nr:YbjN domain-containing protein [Chitinophagaceae bacterium]
MLDKLFGWGKKKESPEKTLPPIRFGRYSDNNKTLEKTQRWTDADNLFKEKKYHESILTFFDYLRDDALQNVTAVRNGEAVDFHFYQGSKVVRGSSNGKSLYAEVTLAGMPQSSVPVMRRLLEQNFNLYYSRYALHNQSLCMRFDADIESANPNKLYYSFKELATKADKQDDLLVQDFSGLQTIDNSHIETIADTEKEIKYKYLQQWINETVTLVESLDAEKMSGGIAHLFLNLAYRIDYLIVPEGKLLYDLEDTVSKYFAKDEKPVAEKNKAMMAAFKVMAQKTKEEVFPFLFRSRHTFAITVPQPQKTIADTVYGANQNMIWYRDNSYPQIAQQVSEYGIGYCQYNFSLPRVITELYHILMMVVYSDFFKELGYEEGLYNSGSKQFSPSLIDEKIRGIMDEWRKKFPQINFKTENLKYDSLLSFTHSFTSEIEFVNTEAK